jgi:UDP-N-acetylglucosamine acyltransferase
MSRIHKTAVVDPKAELHESVEIGPYSVVHSGVTIGAGTRVHSHVVLDGPMTIGRNNTIYPFATTTPRASRSATATRSAST